MKKKNDYYKQSLESITEKGIKTAIASVSKNAEKVIENLNAKR